MREASYQLNIVCSSTHIPDGINKDCEVQNVIQLSVMFKTLSSVVS